MKKIIREAYLTLIQLPLLWLILIAIESVTYGNSLPSEMFLSFITRTTGIVSVVAGLMAFEMPDILSAAKLIRQWHRMKKGRPANHSSASRTGIHWLVTVFILIFAAAGIYTETTHQKAEMPAESDGGYITLNQLGYSGKRTLHYSFESTVLHTETPFCQYWDTHEYIETNDKGDRWMYQEVFRIKGGVKPETVAKALMKSAVFANEEYEFREIQVEGLDRAYSTGNLECVAIKGDMVGIFTAMFESDEDIAATLSAVALHWENIK